MKLKIRKETLKILTDLEAAMVGAAGTSPCKTGATGTECGATCIAACGNDSETTTDCTNDCPTNFCSGS